jgi:hypothetical protein
MDPSSSVSREELRARLRGKLRGDREQRTGQGGRPAAAQRDLSTALLSRGVDDPAMLRFADSISKQPQEAMKQMKHALKDVKRHLDELKTSRVEEALRAPTGIQVDEEEEDDDDEEEAPPPSSRA